MLVHGVELIEDGDMVIRHQQQTGVPFEGESVAAWIDACKPGGVAIDVGAYTGLYAIIAAKAGASVHAFEPNPVVFQRLIDNAELNQVMLAAYQKGVSDAQGSAKLVAQNRIPLTSGGRIEDGEGVELIRVDDLGLSGVTAIKIDVEGYECSVLRGALATIQRDKPLIITEALDDSAFQEQVKILSAIGYTARPADEWNVIWES